MVERYPAGMGTLGRRVAAKLGIDGWTVCHFWHSQNVGAPQIVQRAVWRDGFFGEEVDGNFFHRPLVWPDGYWCERELPEPRVIATDALIGLCERCETGNAVLCRECALVNVGPVIDNLNKRHRLVKELLDSMRHVIDDYCGTHPLG